MIDLKMLFALLLFSTISTSQARSPLEPVKTDHPRDTMVTFMQAMNDYRQGLESGNTKQLNRINDAIRTLNLKDLPVITKKEQGKKAAILLKEVIDRIIIIRPEFIPNSIEIERWRLKDTEITIAKVMDGDRTGEFLFTPSTVERAEEFFAKVKDLPYLKNSGRGAMFRESWDLEYFPSWAQKQVLGVCYWQALGLFIAILFGFILKTLAEFIVKGIKVFITEEESSFRYRFIRALEKPIGLLIASAFWFFSIHYLRFEGESLALLTGVIQVILGISVIWAAYRLVDVVSLTLHKWADRTESDLDDQLVPMLTKSLRIFIVVFGILLIFQNLGFNVMSLLAGLGLGGLAFALAAKDTAANLFGSIMILLDRPFRVGDWIRNSSVEGTVEHIGFRSTRIRTFYNSLISIPNSILATTNIDNMGLREYRRVRADLGVTYDTPPEKIEAFIEGIKNIIQANPSTRKDYFHVVFNGYGSFSLDIMVYYFLTVPDWTDELIEKQNIFLEILRLAHNLEVDFAYPTQTLHMETFPEKAPTVIRHESWTKEQIRSTAAGFAKGGALAKPRGLGIFKRPFGQTALPGDDDQ